MFPLFRRDREPTLGDGHTACPLFIFFHELLLDVIIHGITKITMTTQDSIALIQNVLLQKLQAARPGLGWCRIAIFINDPLCQRDFVYIALSDQPAENVSASFQAGYRVNTPSGGARAARRTAEAGSE
jgi:hypothetical protein